MRISDWSSDVCSSDLAAAKRAATARAAGNWGLAAQGVPIRFQLKVRFHGRRDRNRIHPRNADQRRGQQPGDRADLAICKGSVVRKSQCARRLSVRSEEHTSELQSLMRISYAVFCLKKKNNKQKQQ